VIQKIYCADAIILKIEEIALSDHLAQFDPLVKRILLFGEDQNVGKISGFCHRIDDKLLKRRQRCT
jgi:hypothetical protein